MNKEALVTLSLQEIDTTLFDKLTAEMKPLFPTDHRQALRIAMHAADAVMVEFTALAQRQAKSVAAKAAAEARWSGASPSTMTVTGATNADGTTAPSIPASTDTPKKRHRRTKAEIAAALAVAAGVTPPIPTPPYHAPVTPPGQPIPGAPWEGLPPGVDGSAAGAPNVDAAVAAASGSPINTPASVPPPPLLIPIPTFGS